MSDIGGGIAALFFLALTLGFYFLPTIVAGIRHVPNVGSVLVINLLLGWTFIGWVVAMAMAARSLPGGGVHVHNHVGPGQAPVPPPSGDPSAGYPTAGHPPTGEAGSPPVGR